MMNDENWLRMYLRSRPRGVTWFWMGAVVICVYALLFPGDIPFINDEPWTVHLALTQNQKGQLIREGLPGSLGMKYGPVPLWFYQLMLLITHNLMVISFTKNLLHLVIFIYALRGLGGELKVTQPFALLVLGSPYLLLVNRMLWLFGFMGPLSGCLAFWLLRFRRTGKYRYFLYSVLTTISFVYTHPISAFIVMPFYLCLFVFCYERLWVKKTSCIVTLIIALAVVSPLIFQLLSHHGKASASPEKSDILHSFLATIHGSYYFTMVGWFEYYLPNFYQKGFLLPKTVLHVMIYTTGLSCILYLIGVTRCVALWIKSFRRKSFTSRDMMTFYSLATVLFSATFFIITRLEFQPHYSIPLWFPFFFFIWIALNWIWKKRPLLIPLFGIGWICHAILLVFMTTYINKNGGNREIHYGATLKNQIQVANTVKAASHNSKIVTNVRNYQLFPYSLSVLISLSDENSSVDAGNKLLQIVYAEPNSSSGWIKVVSKPLTKPNKQQKPPSTPEK